MKKILFLALFFIGLNAENKLFLGIGSGYGFGSSIIGKGFNNQVGDQYHKEDTIQFEALIGGEKFFLSSFGIRYYANFGYSFMKQVQKNINSTDVGLNVDLIGALPLSETLGLRFFGGLNAQAGLLSGSNIDKYKKTFDQFDAANSGAGNYTIGYSSLAPSVSLNLGMNVVFYTHHVLELGGRFVILKKRTALFHYKSTLTPNDPRQEIVLKQPDASFSLKYIFIF